MRLLHVNHRYAPFAGGSEQYVQQVSEHRARLGDSVTVVTTDAFDIEYFWDAGRARVCAPSRETIGGVTVVRTPVRHVPAGALTLHVSRRLAIELGRFERCGTLCERLVAVVPRVPGIRRAFATAGPTDIVHATNLGLEGLALAAAEYARRRGARLILTPFLHVGDGRNRFVLRHLAQPHQRRLLRSASAVIVMTAFEAGLVRSLGVDERRIVVSGAGVDPAEVTGGDPHVLRATLGNPRFLIGALGAMAVDKGTPHLVEAVAALRCQGIDIVLALAGPQLRAFERWFAALPERKRTGVRVLGVIDAAAKRDFLAAIDVLALPSRTESFGIVYLEAWANRKPVIAADISATRDVVCDDSGIRVPFGDVRALTEAIRRLIEDGDFAGRLGATGHERVMRQFQWPAVLRRVDEAYDIAMHEGCPAW